MNKTRFETGMENLKKIDGDSGNAVIHSLENISPDLGTYIVEFAFGDIYAICPPPCMSDFPKKKFLRPSSSASPIPVVPKS